MSTIDPAKVRGGEDQPHHIFDWSVPGSVAGEPLAFRKLDYERRPRQLQPDPDRTVIALALAAGIVWWARREARAGELAEIP